jgi:hypothetical protein
MVKPWTNPDDTAIAQQELHVIVPIADPWTGQINLHKADRHRLDLQ